MKRAKVVGLKGKGMRAKRRPGDLLVIGGKEDREGDARILHEVARRTHGGKLCVATVASKVGHEQWEEYRAVFHKMGVKNISHLDVVNRKEIVDERALAAVKGARTVFFTGGDQLRITAELGGTAIADAIFDVFQRGGLIAGTSAGASVMSETMMFAGPSKGTVRIGEGVQMAPGLGYLKGIIVDQHFSERGRIGRLLAAVALNPRFLGIGIDEDTAVIVEKGVEFCVMGAGAVYVIDAHESTSNNVSDACTGRCLSISNVKCHVLSEPDRFDLRTRKVYHHEEEAA